jgi:hypothetical protein
MGISGLRVRRGGSGNPPRRPTDQKSESDDFVDSVVRRSSDSLFSRSPSTIGSPLNSKLNLNHDPSPLDDGICAHSSLTVELWHDGGPPAGNQDPRLALFIEPLDSQVRAMARPSSILAALHAEKVVKTCKFTHTSMLKSLRIVGGIPGGLDRPRPSSSWRNHEATLIDSDGTESTPRSTTGRYQMTPRTASTR